MKQTVFNYAEYERLQEENATLHKELTALAIESVNREKTLARLEAEVIAAASIQSELEQVKAERDKAIADLHHNDACKVCIGSGVNESDCPVDCENCKLDCRCYVCHNEDKWQWRGLNNH